MDVLSIDQLWRQVLDRLQLQLSRPTFETWIKSTRAEKLEDGCLTVRTPHPFARNWLKKYYYLTIREIVADVLGQEVEVQFVFARGEEDLEIGEVESSLPLPPVEPHVLERNAAAGNSNGGVQANDLNPKYLFSRFVVGSNNRMAHVAAIAAAERPGIQFNPLFLCGGVGLGKTHLMQAIGHYRIENCPDSRVYYVSTEKFTNDLITAIRRDSMQSFREHYRDVDVLLVDDIQFIEGKEYTQEEFFHTFNTLHEAGKQVVLASDRPPNQIPRLQERLCSRFSMGLIADIQPPDLETRMAILQKKAEYERIRLPQEVIHYIASSYTSNIRELEGALIRAVAYISISGLPMSVENIAPVLDPPNGKVEVSPELVLKTVAEHFNITVDDLKSNSRRREISQPRQIAMYLVRQHTGLSLPKIGEVFGGKDHTTVIYSCDKTAQLQKTDPATAQLLRQLTDRILLEAQQ
nr:chromosomal replication initiator protein DnaA [Leptolyngbya sp. FACHB-261]